MVGFDDIDQALEVPNEYCYLKGVDMTSVPWIPSLWSWHDDTDQVLMALYKNLSF